jgi:hypothetical protein
MMGLAWALVWMPIGLVIGFIVDPDGSMDEPWILIGTYPGFLCGVVFSVMAGLAARRANLEQISLSLASWRGGVSGLLVGGLFFVLVVVSDPPQWSFLAGVIGSLTVLSAISGAGSALLARIGKNDVSAYAAT